MSEKLGLPQKNYDMKERFVALMMRKDSLDYSRAVMFMVYQTIKANDTILLKHVYAMLGNEYFISESNIDAAVSGLTSRAMYNCVNRWLNNTPEQDSQTKNRNVSLNTRKPIPDDFQSWLERVVKELPEIKVFIPTIYKKNNRAA